jgi:hypothetical protein
VYDAIRWTQAQCFNAQRRKAPDSLFVGAPVRPDAWGYFMGRRCENCLSLGRGFFQGEPHRLMPVAAGHFGKVPTDSEEKD